MRLHMLLSALRLCCKPESKFTLMAMIWSSNFDHTTSFTVRNIVDDIGIPINSVRKSLLELKEKQIINNLEVTFQSSRTRTKAYALNFSHQLIQCDEESINLTMSLFQQQALCLIFEGLIEKSENGYPCLTLAHKLMLIALAINSDNFGIVRNLSNARMSEILQVSKERCRTILRKLGKLSLISSHRHNHSNSRILSELNVDYYLGSYFTSVDPHPSVLIFDGENVIKEIVKLVNIENKDKSAYSFQGYFTPRLAAVIFNYRSRFNKSEKKKLHKVDITYLNLFLVHHANELINSKCDCLNEKKLCRCIVPSRKIANELARKSEFDCRAQHLIFLIRIMAQDLAGIVLYLLKKQKDSDFDYKTCSLSLANKVISLNYITYQLLFNENG